MSAIGRHRSIDETGGPGDNNRPEDAIDTPAHQLAEQEIGRV